MVSKPVRQHMWSTFNAWDIFQPLALGLGSFLPKQLIYSMVIKVTLVIHSRELATFSSSLPNSSAKELMKKSMCFQKVMGVATHLAVSVL